MVISGPTRLRSAPSAVADQGQDVRRVGGGEPNEGVLPPAPGLTGDLVMHQVDVPGGQPESLHVEVDLRLDYVVRVEADHGDDGVVPVALGVDDGLLVRRV